MQTIYNNACDGKIRSTEKLGLFTNFEHATNEYDCHRAYIKNYLLTNNCQSIEILLNESGVCQSFNYATYNNPQVHSYDYNAGSIDINDILMLENWTLTGDECENEDMILNLSLSKNI